MKRFLIVLFTAASMGMAVNAQTNDVVTALLNPYGLWDNPKSEEVNTDNDEYAYGSDSENKTDRERSVPNSASTSNGKTVSATTTSVSGSERMNGVESLAVYKVFGDKYKRMPGCRLTVIDNKDGKYRSLDVNDNAEIVSEIRRLINLDRKKATGVTETYSEDSDKIIMNFDNICVGFSDYINGNRCKVFISW